jgi:RNA polymerase sigma factor (sigma-70 family)
MCEPGSISVWLESLQQGDESVAAQLWCRFHQQLVSIARDRIRGSRQRVADGEDVVVDAFDSFFRRAQKGQFPNLRDRHDLWSLLVTITERKAVNLIRDQGREKRGGGRVRGDSVFFPDEPIAATTSVPSLDCLPSPVASPDAAAAFAETLENLLQNLGDQHRQIALFKLEGRTNVEIAKLLDCAVSTVERRLRLIRRCWVEARHG